MLLGGWRAGLIGERLIFYVLYVVTFFGIVIGLRVWMSVKWKLDWDVRDRPKRVRPLIIALLIVFGNWFIIPRWESAVLTNLFIFFVLWLLGFFLITLFYKISGHVSAVTVAVGLFVSWFGVSWWFLWLIVPLVTWARIVGKHHTPGQAILGAFYSLLLLAIFGNLTG